ncbi:hypothetical protein IV203_014721 [Nitzschia inconspicua]|uniref:Uncharacterized protein n=1 Tax=Nitzschia inconspicua TaxID=303405 RepID=A0A9K3LAH0_9STRA|nr:hypothetical protein IV203_014721 [Nitzschia inconspicua]
MILKITCSLVVMLLFSTVTIVAQGGAKANECHATFPTPCTEKFGVSSKSCGTISGEVDKCCYSSKFDEYECSNSEKVGTIVDEANPCTEDGYVLSKQIQPFHWMCKKG